MTLLTVKCTNKKNMMKSVNSKENLLKKETMDNKTNYLELLDNNRQQFTQYNAADFKADTKHAEKSCFEALRKRTVRRERKLMPTPLRRTIRQRVTNKLIVEGKQRLIADTRRLMQ